MQDILAVITQVQGIPHWVLVAVLTVTGLFLFLYLPRAIHLGLQLGLYARRVRALRQPGASVEPDTVGRVLAREPYRRLWSEYRESLHRIVDTDAQGESRPAIRATVPAGALFTRDALVDGRLFDEFVRHLPGILTGLGIIGTFAGLLTGLQGFTPSEDPSVARLGLKALLGGVEHAFYASAVAISCAILITLLEKFAIARCYQAADALAGSIDALYSGGAGEDYLAQLVRGSQANARASVELKDALVDELRATLTALGERQLEQNRRQAEALGAQLAQAVGDGLARPIRELVAVVQGGAGRAALASPGAAPDSVAAGLAQRMTDTVESTLVKAAAQQEAFSAQTRAIVVDIHRQSQEQQAQVEQSLRSTVRGVLADVSDALASFASERQAQDEAQLRRQVQFDASVDAMSAAAKRFAAAGEAASGTVGSLVDTGERMAVTALTLQQVGATVEHALAQYELARASIDAQLGALGELIDNAKQEAGLNKTLLADMQNTVDGLRGVQQASNRHLELVNEKLAAAFESFGDSLKVQVAGVMRQTDQHTSTAMQHLLGVVQELGGALSRLKRA